MENLISSKFKNKLKYFVLICGCLIAATTYALETPLNLKNSKLTESSYERTNPDLAKAKNCLTCHQVAVKVTGPAFKDVSKKYAGQKDAEDKLVKKVMKGGTGVWGAMPMPANAQVSEKDAHILVKWILTLK